MSSTPDLTDSDGQQTPQHVCPECGEEHDTAIRLGLHRRKEHGVLGSSREQTARGERSPRRTRTETSHTRRKRAVKETIVEFLDFSDEIRGRSDRPAEDLADVLRRDVDRIADSVSWAAERFNPLAWAVDHLAGHGGVITFARGFLGVGTWLVRKWRQALEVREQALAEQQMLQEYPPEKMLQEYPPEAMVGGDAPPA